MTSASFSAASITHLLLLRRYPPNNREKIGGGQCPEHQRAAAIVGSEHSRAPRGVCLGRNEGLHDLAGAQRVEGGQRIAEWADDGGEVRNRDLLSGQ